VSFDNSRFTFDPFKDYSGVVMEQGRVQLDSDWNEWLAELSRRIQAGTLDIMGRAVYPATTPYAFQIFASSSGGKNTIDIGVGRMYVDGLLAENHGNPTTAVWDPALAELSGSPQPPPSSPVFIDFGSQPYNPGATAPTTSGQYLAYLDVWLRPVTYLEDSALVDAAVGVDTTGRLQTVWQVNLKPVPSGSGWTCGTPESGFDFPRSSAQLSNGTVTSGPSGPCCLTTGTGYTGVENQFYRVEIHAPGVGGGANATVKWSRENASVQTGVTAITTGANSLGASASVLTVMSLGRDQVLGFNVGNWIEITNDTLQLNCLPGELYKIDSVDVSSKTVTLTTMLSSTFPATSLTTNKNTRIIRWDQSGKILKSDNSVYYDLDAPGSGGMPNGFYGIPVPTDGSTLLLESGITVQFGLSSPTGNYLSGDFWTFSARTADGSIDRLADAPPRGIHHHYTALSIVTFGATTSATDCRSKWPPAGEGGCGCCTYTVGDGTTSFGAYSSIQAAINALPVTGGEVCILPGHFYEHVLLQNLKDVVIHGCGWQTHLYSPSLQPGANAAQAASTPTESGFASVFTVVGSTHIELSSFSVHAADGEIGILLDRGLDTWKQPAPGPGGIAPDILYLVKGTGDTDVTIEELAVTASTLPAIIAVSVTGLKIANNKIAMKDVGSLWAAAYLSGDNIFFERNHVTLFSAKLASQVANSDLVAITGDATAAPGGIHIAGPSKNIFVLENEIVGGRRNGITLGNFIILDANGVDTGKLTGLIVETENVCSTGGSSQIPGTTPGPTPTSPPSKIAAGGLIQNLHIDRNIIRNFGMCGIGPIGFFDLTQVLEVISLVNVSITSNVIAHTLTRAVIHANGLGYGAISVPDVENLIIRDNIISDFGVTPGAEVCGVFVLHGQMIEISRNQIKEARDWSVSPTDAVTSAGATRAGILILLVTPATIDGANTGSAWNSALSKQNVDWATESSTGLKPDAPTYAPGMPALRIQENVVRVAIGLALEVLGYGPFEIVGNHFSSGGTVTESSDALRNYAYTAAPTDSSNTTVAGALTVMILNLGLALEDVNPGYGYSKLYAAAATNEQANEASLASSSNGTVLFTNNVCQLEAWASGVRGLSSVAIFSLDHVLFANNQLWLDGPTLTAVLDLLVFGLTIQVCANRLQESRKYPVLASGVAAGWVNITSQNISTYCLKATALPTFLVDAQNLVLFSTLCPKG